ncbi:MAG: extracellular solute-binding protein [Actinobacteria bacterium]|nr:extracellular solute-binding protein [Actinomycetota bacterium]
MLAASFASAQPTERASMAGGKTLNIYGFGPGDDVANGRAEIAAKALGGASVDNPRGSFNDQAFLTRLASGDVPDVVYMSRDRIGTYAARGALLPLASCLRSESIDRKQYRAAAIAEVTYKGQLYALPEFTNQITIIVNNDVAKAAGVSLADISTTKWARLRQANKKMLKIENGKVTRIGFDPKIPEFFPLWVKWFGADLVSKDGLKAQLNTKQAVAALEFTYSLIRDHGGWDRFKAFRDTFDFFGTRNPVVANQMGAWPFESFYYNVLADNSPNADITAKYFTNRKGGPITLFAGSGWAIPRGSKDPDLACKWMKAMTAVNTWVSVAKDRLNLRRRQGRAFTGIYTANTNADRKVFEDVYQASGKKQFDDAVKLLVQAPRYGFSLPSSPASQQLRQAYIDAINRVLAGQQTPRVALDQAQREAQDAIDKAK